MCGHSWVSLRRGQYGQSRNLKLRKGLLLTLMFLVGCDQAPSLERFGGPTMGSSYSIQYVREPGGP